MSDGEGAPAPAPAPTAGRLLREAREKQGLHIAALAASIKVSPKKLELLESDRFDELPDATFTRALAQTVCRALKTDPSVVMRLLPPPVGHRLEQVGEGLNTPFRERPGTLVPRDWMQFVASPAVWLTVLILVAAVVVYFLPPSLTGLPTGRLRAASAAAQAGVEPGMPPDAANEASAAVPGAAPATVTATPVAEARDVAPAPAVAGSAAVAATPIAAMAPARPVAPPAALAASAAASAPEDAAMPPGMLQLHTVSPSWIEVNDGRGQPLVFRLMKAGESAGVDGVSPLRVRIGNAAGTQLLFRGQPTDLKAFTRDNVARLELK